MVSEGVLVVFALILAVSGAPLWSIPYGIRTKYFGTRTIWELDDGFLIGGRPDPYAAYRHPEPAVWLSRYALNANDPTLPPKVIWNYTFPFSGDNLWGIDMKTVVKNNRALIWLDKSREYDGIVVVDLSSGQEIMRNSSLGLNLASIGCWAIDLSPDGRFVFLGSSRSGSGRLNVLVFDSATGGQVANLTIADEQRCGIHWFTDTLFGLGVNPTLNIYDTATFSLRLSQRVAPTSLPYTMNCPGHPTVAIQNELVANWILFYGYQPESNVLKQISAFKVPQYELKANTLVLADQDGVPCSLGAAISYNYFSPPQKGQSLVYDFYINAFDINKGTFLPGSPIKINSAALDHVSEYFLSGTDLLNNDLVVGYNTSFIIYQLSDFSVPAVHIPTLSPILEFRVLKRMGLYCLVVESRYTRDDLFLSLYKLK